VSTSFYFECLAHDPHIQSDEISQHFDWYVEQALQWATGTKPLPADPWATGTHEFEVQAASFLLQHPRCPLRLVDEYGRHTSIVGRGEDGQRAALEREVAQQEELIRQAHAAVEAAQKVASEAYDLLHELGGGYPPLDGPLPEENFWDDRTTPGANG
jgi:hypothetical protein